MWSSPRLYIYILQLCYKREIAIDWCGLFSQSGCIFSNASNHPLTRLWLRIVSSINSISLAMSMCPGLQLTNDQNIRLTLNTWLSANAWKQYSWIGIKMTRMKTLSGRLKNFRECKDHAGYILLFLACCCKLSCVGAARWNEHHKHQKITIVMVTQPIPSL